MTGVQLTMVLLGELMGKAVKPKYVFLSINVDHGGNVVNPRAPMDIEFIKRNQEGGGLRERLQPFPAQQLRAETFQTARGFSSSSSRSSEATTPCMYAYFCLLFVFLILLSRVCLCLKPNIRGDLSKGLLVVSV